MIKKNESTFECEHGYIFVDKETEMINHGKILQIGVVLDGNGNFINDDISNYKEVLESDFFEKDKNITNYLKNYNL